MDPDGRHATGRALPRPDGAFSLDSADQLRPRAPGRAQQGVGSEYAEVEAIGWSTSATRTRTRPWPPGSGPNHRSSRPAARSAVRPRPPSRRGASGTVHGDDVGDFSADALIACSTRGCRFAFWRPITAIRAGDTDSNAATVGDPAWTPRCPSHRTTRNIRARTPVSRPPRDGSSPDSSGRRGSSSRPQPDRSRRSSLRPRQRSGVRSQQRPHLGRHPLPLGRRGRGGRSRSGSPTRCSVTTPEVG